jgi:hypothetical protein
LPAPDPLSLGLRIFAAMDPSAQEVFNFNTVPLLCAWAGISDDLLARISTALGGHPQVRHIALIPYKVWDSAICKIPRVPNPDPVFPDNEPESIGPTPTEWGYIYSLRRAAHILCSLPAQEADIGSQEDRELPPSTPPSLDPKSTLKLSELVNPLWDNKLIPLTEATTNLMYPRYKTVFGMDPPENLKPTTDQISAIEMLDDLGYIPAVDFSLFGPHDRRAMKKLTYAAQMWDPETQSFKQRDLPGPPDFETWLRSWKVFKFTCLILDTCKVQPLDAYSDHIRSLHQEHGQKHWFIILQADSRLRKTRFERWLRIEEAKADRSEMNPNRKWDFLFMAAAEPEYTTARNFWGKEVTNHVVSYSSFRKIV